MGDSPQKFAEFPQPAVAVDLALMTVTEGELRCLAMHREDAGEVGGEWALPGGFVRLDVALETTVRDVLLRKANLKDAYLEQLGTFGEMDRDPRGRVISIAYFALSPVEALLSAIEARPDLLLAKVAAPWEGETGGPADLVSKTGEKLELAFDHADILGAVVRRLRGKIDYTTVGLELLPSRFTLREVQEIHEAILGRKLTKPAFRRKLLDRGQIRPTGERETATSFRPAELYERVS